MPALGKGGSLASRQAILHSLVHIESWAVDLSWDAVARFGSDPQYALPEAFLDDFVQVRQTDSHNVILRGQGHRAVAPPTVLCSNLVNSPSHHVGNRQESVNLC